MFTVARSLLIFALLCGPAAAQGMSCGTRGEMVASLAKKYGEHLRWVGIDSQGRLTELFASDDRGTWTILMTLPNLPTCLVAHGRGSEMIEVKTGDPL